MKVNLLTDAPKHNLALMKISSYYKKYGWKVTLNQPLNSADFRIGSWIFLNSARYPCDYVGGTGIDPTKRLDSTLDNQRPDYELFNLGYSLGYTWAYCPRKCGFCVVPKQNNPKIHRSIWDFHDERFGKICLLNNNTFSDPRWRETFWEIWDADLTVIDENGYDLRLLDEEKAEALKRTRFAKRIHFAWDQIDDETAIKQGLKIANDFKLRALVYVLMGYDTTFEQDLYRCQIIHDHGFHPYPMLYKKTRLLQLFRRFIYLRYYRQYPTIQAAWQQYTGGKTKK